MFQQQKKSVNSIEKNEIGKKISVQSEPRNNLLPFSSVDALEPLFELEKNVQVEYPFGDEHQNEGASYKCILDDGSDFGDFPQIINEIQLFADEPIKIYSDHKKQEKIPAKKTKKSNQNKKTDKKIERKYQPKTETTIPEKQSQTQQKNKATTGCNCKKTKCLKSYCECFSKKQACTDLCKCFHCQNIDFLKQSQPVEAKATCNCRRTKCLKKYCECFSRGKSCREQCRCFDCQNC